MKINDVIKEVDLSKRAIKYYEEEGLLKVQRNHNGYRDY
ncbi:MerR family transcriptional regulator [Holdemanella porci]|nr:MerR family transcriptional regulator [Holdemanella porci]